MIALDTNVLVRFLVEDDRDQSARAASLIEQAVAASDQLFISDIVMCEMVWVLSGAYRFTRDEIASTLSDLVRARHLRFREPDEIARALRAFGVGRGDFADYLIREQARAAGCDRVATFDRALLVEDDFEAP